ncbi:hypothetical protein DV738_g4147, partial [Chaetothyriales sp. CBS 135597]
MVNVFDPPESVINSWPTPNYVNPETHGPGLVIICILMASLGVVVVSIRLYSRAFITRALGIDDALIVVASAFAIALSVLNALASSKWMTDRHVWDIPRSTFVGHRINVWASLFCMTMGLSLTKISILLFFRRLSVSFSRGFLIAAWVGIVYNILYIIGIVLASCLICRPLSAFWLEFDPRVGHKYHEKCRGERILEPLTAVFSSIGDVYTTLLPMIQISRLDLPTAQKRALYLLFSLGWLVVVTGIVRIIYLFRLLTVTYDFTWTLWEMWIQTQVEMWMAVCVASAPALKPLAKKLATRLGLTFSEVSHKLQGFSTSTGGYRNSRSIGVGDGSTEEYEIGKAIVMRNGQVRYTVKSRYSANDSTTDGHESGSTVGGYSSSDDKANTRSQHRWKREGSWNRMESPGDGSHA